MKSKIYMLICFAFFITRSLAQAPSIQWEKSLGGTNYDYGSSIRQTTDGVNYDYSSPYSLLAHSLASLFPDPIGSLQFMSNTELFYGSRRAGKVVNWFKFQENYCENFIIKPYEGL